MNVRRLESRERPSADKKNDGLGDHDSQSEPLLRRTWRQARENKGVFL
jgi:hypothetical protein